MIYLLPLLLGSSLAQYVTELSSYDWHLQNENQSISIPANFPSYAHLDLANNGIVGELEYGLNNFNLRWIWRENWTYSTVLTSFESSHDHAYLLFQGLDTFASIDLCGQHVASTNNQFRQYCFDVSNITSECRGNLSLNINFGSAPLIAQAIADEPGQETWPYGVEEVFEIPNRQFIRKEQNDFGWDW